MTPAQCQANCKATLNSDETACEIIYNEDQVNVLNAYRSLIQNCKSHYTGAAEAACENAVNAEIEQALNEIRAYHQFCTGQAESNWQACFAACYGRPRT